MVSIRNYGTDLWTYKRKSRFLNLDLGRGKEDLSFVCRP